MHADKELANVLPRLANVDASLREGIRVLNQTSSNYWDFKGTNRTKFDRSPFQYPAMMVPALQRELVALILRLQPDVANILDPFTGSGTVLCETMLSGRNFSGQDINPLAVLISRMRHSALDTNAIGEGVKATLARATKDSSDEYAIRFTNQSKWFNKGVSIALSRLYRAIRKEASQQVRLFLWVALAETVRFNSNSRTSTYKLHVKAPEDQNANFRSTFDTFKYVSERNLKIASEFKLTLEAKGQLTGNRFRGTVGITLGDSTQALPVIAPIDRAQLIMSSPPYGDNKTTVPYGQAAWLPLQWVDPSDLGDPELIRQSLVSTHQIDTQSLGGRAERRKLKDKIEELSTFSKSFQRTIDHLSSLPHDGTQRFTEFVYDLNKVLKNGAEKSDLNAYTVWTLGNRRIRNIECPLTDIMSELSAKYGLEEVDRIHRNIPSKRMALKNNFASTMRTETILIMRKAAEKA